VVFIGFSFAAEDQIDDRQPVPTLRGAGNGGRSPVTVHPGDREPDKLYKSRFRVAM
jgi:hypothetical protein